MDDLATLGAAHAFPVPAVPVQRSYTASMALSRRTSTRLERPALRKQGLAWTIGSYMYHLGEVIARTDDVESWHSKAQAFV